MREMDIAQPDKTAIHYDLKKIARLTKTAHLTKNGIFYQKWHIFFNRKFHTYLNKKGTFDQKWHI